MNKFLTIPFLFLTLAFVSSTYAQETIEITNDEVREISTRLQSYSQSELIERQLFLQNELQKAWINFLAKQQVVCIFIF